MLYSPVVKKFLRRLIACTAITFQLGLTGNSVAVGPTSGSTSENARVFSLEIKSQTKKISAKEITKNSQNWGLSRIEAPKAWKKTKGRGIRVAVLDTGVDSSHPILRKNLKGGVSTVSYTDSYQDDNGHGTHVAGVIAAAKDKRKTIGVGPRISLYSVKVLEADGTGSVSDLVRGIEWAIENKIQVVNMSLGTYISVPELHDVVKKASAAGIILVGAAGNNRMVYPAAYPEVISVSALDKNNSLVPWTPQDEKIDLSAPGMSIFSAYKSGGYALLSGTSTAAPFVSGSAALVMASPVCTKKPSHKCSGDEIRSILEKNSLDLGPPGKDSSFGSGLLNAGKAVQKSKE